MRHPHLGDYEDGARHHTGASGEEHFDDSDAEACTFETDPGFQGRPVDPEFLPQFWRDQFVSDDWTIETSPLCRGPRRKPIDA